jgi:hypothetical protein
MGIRPQKSIAVSHTTDEQDESHDGSTQKGYIQSSNQSNKAQSMNHSIFLATHQIPCHAMDIKQSTTDGYVEVLEDLFRQGGIGDKHDSSFNADHDVDMTEHVILVHGDLLTKERLDTVCNSRWIEYTPKN